MKRIIDLKNLIRTNIIEDYIKDNNLTKTKFCKFCKISIDTFNRIMTGKNFRVNALLRISKIINVELYQLFY